MFREDGRLLPSEKTSLGKVLLSCELPGGRVLDSKVDPKWLWKGRRVYMFDGTTVSMPDTTENQEAYPQIPGQRPGLGFPIARIGAITSLS